MNQIIEAREYRISKAKNMLVDSMDRGGNVERTHINGEHAKLKSASCCLE